jgi:hypothetical protein
MDVENNFTELEKQYIESVLSSAKVTKTEEHAIFGENLFALKNNVKILQYIAAVKVKRATRRDLLDKMGFEEFCSLIPSAKNVLRDALAGVEVSREQLDASKYVLSVTKAYLTKVAENTAHLETGVIDEALLSFPALRYDPKDFKPS